ncbi:hypothetical protein C8F04DRAFT_614113 [Mycena alexandri]|uniref:Uncharacterized protein n=1 Tax=Mycena alexandri TaxID=1745969 RepID=A0AAD6X206_9AGAR|nr:hypothetical protein C8F04DRAFT_614113 [Mycena alexandri]
MAVPLSALAASPDDTSTKLSKRFLFSQVEDYLQHRQIEYLWGMEIHTIDPTHELSVICIRKSMETLPKGSWTLVPTEETLATMKALQVHNYTVPVSERKSFLAEFPAAEHEYIFVPLSMDVDFFVLEPGRSPQRFSAPYDNFPRVTSSANPFFVAFYSQLKIRSFRASASPTWNRLFSTITVPWCSSVLPEDFLLSCYPESLISESGDESEPDPELKLHSKSGSDETVLTPVDEGPSPVPEKESFVKTWVKHRRRDAYRVYERPTLSSPSPWPPAPREERARALRDAVKMYASWHRETERGRNCTRRFFRDPLPKQMIS